MMQREADTIRIDIFIAGDIEQAKHVCREFCLEVGLCVTVEPVDYVYTGGEEAGVRIGLINYPRFPTTLDAIKEKALRLADRLMHRLCQQSYSVVCPDATIWCSRRPEDTPSPQTNLRGSLTSLVRNEVIPALEATGCNVSLAADVRRALAEERGGSVYEFERYVNGRLMAEGVTVEKAKNFEEAMATAARLASRGPNREVPVLVLRSPSPQPNLSPGLKETILLQIIAASGGSCDSSDHRWNWINWFCNDETERNGTDTFNRCNDKGWLHTTHNTDMDTSTTTLTAAGRAALATTEGSGNDA